MPLLTGARTAVGAVRRRGQNWIARRVRREAGPVSIQRKRLYILPTRSGLVFALLLLVMLLGAMNYSNSLGFMLTFLLTGMGLIGMHHTHRNLLHLQVEPGAPRRVFLGDPAAYEIRLRNASRQPRHSIRLEHAENGHVDIPALDSIRVVLKTRAPRRGRQSAPRFKLVTEYPLGLFRAWTWVELDMHCLVYPRPVRGRDTATARPRTGGQREGRRGNGENFTGLRTYRHGDSPQRVHWRAAAHSRQLLVKQFAEPEDDTLWLDWEQFTGLPTETRLSRLCHRVLTAHRAGLSYALKIPGRHIRPGSGEAHRNHCLETLALFREPAAPQAAFSDA